MDESTNINILIAEDNEITRELMSSILKIQGYNIIPAIDGGDAISAIDKNIIDVALVDLNMEPKGGFEFVKHLIKKNINIPVIIITADNSSDVLLRASELNIKRVLQKPVEPDRIVSVVQQVLKKYGHHTNQNVRTYKTSYTPEQLMQRAIEIAERNAKMLKGGPFGAVISNDKGEVLGEGANGITSRIDPTAHAEIMAIRKAAEKLGKSDLSDCTLYCSSQPTMMGQALINSVGIKQIYYGISHEDINDLRAAQFHNAEKPKYTQLGHNNAMTMFKRWQDLDNKIAD